MHRHTLYKAMSFIFLVFSIIIRIQNPEEPFRVIFPPPGSCSPALGQTLVQGICTVTMNPAAQPPPAPPPATYYFLREHCQEIESKYQSQVESFEYYTDGVRTANAPPFQICNVTVKNGTSLPQPLLDFGRYFEDFGSTSIKRTLGFYLDRTYDPKSIDYTRIIIATTGFHPDTTEGGYCGPDSSGQPNKRCEWVEYFRDCMIACYSRKLNRRFLIPMLLKKDIKTNTFTLYNDYSEVDCGVNPFAIKKGENPANAAYDCFGRKMNASLFDSCGNLPFYETQPIYIPAQAYPNQFYWTYSSSWEVPEKSFPGVSVPGIPKTCPKSCYDSELGMERCSDVDIMREHCALSHYWGPISNGYFYAQHCYDLNIDPISRTFPTGFCNTDVIQGAVEDEEAIYESTYNDARTLQWDRSFDLSVEDVPCKDYDTMSLIKNFLYFQQVCIHPTPPSSPDPCHPLPSFFPMYRPYELICRRTLIQIKFDYETDNGNSQICDYNKKKMKLPVGVPVHYTVEGVTRSFHLFYGCHGKPLFPIDPKHNCVYPALNGVCEVNSGLFLLLYGDCIDPDVIATGFMIAPVAGFGLCQQFVNLEHPIFENNLRKLISDDLLDDLKIPWEQNPWKKSITIRDSPGTSSCSIDLNAHYCGVHSVALNYPYDGYDSRSQDRFLCNWEAYYRDCMQPYRSKFGTNVDWMYLPKWVPSPNLIQSDVQRNTDPVLNSFAIHPAKDLVTCDGRSFPSYINPPPGGLRSTSVDNYWMDDCGWVITPEFVDGDPKSLAIMAPILPIVLDSVYDDNGKLTTKIIHCYDSEVSIFRCTHPDVFPICKRRLAHWEPTQGAILTCYRYNSSCFSELNKQPIGGAPPFLHPPGFCRGYCPHVDTLSEAISEEAMNVWKDIENMEFTHPPCLAISNSTPKIFLNDSSPREVERQLFLQIHCNDPSDNQLVTNHFWWPFYTTTRGTMKLIPRQLIRSHLEASFGSACDYGGISTEENIYPKSVTFMDGTNPVTVAREDFYGCHGFPLVLFSKFHIEYPIDIINVTDTETDYRKVCLDQRLAGWCEVELETFYFLKEDFQVTCNDCLSECTSWNGYFGSHNLSRLIEDHSTYPFLVKTTRKLLRNERSKNFPARSLNQTEHDVVVSAWNKYKNPKTHIAYLNDYRKRLAGPESEHCHHPDSIKFERYCTFPKYMEQCYVPCELVYPDKYVTNVSQSIVKGRTGTVNNVKESYLQPLVFYMRHPSIIEPSFSFVDCVIDPTHIKRKSFGCNLLEIREFDSFGFGKVPEFLPDFNSTLPVGQFKLGYPQTIDFEYELLKNYINPAMTYSPNPPKINVTARTFVSSYFNCFRFSTESMRIPIISATESYWTNTIVHSAIMNESTYLYHPENDVAANLCYEAPLRIWLHWKACKFWNIPSKVRRVYGICEMILPLGLFNSSYAAVEFKGEPPLGCMQRSYLKFDEVWKGKAYGTKTVAEDMFPDLNYYCNSCAYSKQNHYNNVQLLWCGFSHYRPHWYFNYDCLERSEFTYDYFHKKRYTQVQLPITTAQKTMHMANDFATLWLSWHQYACWKEATQEWKHYLRPYHYHSYGIHKVQGKLPREGDKKLCQRLVPIPINAYGCPYPCKNQDESEDCNSKCKFEDFNLCDNPLRIRQSPQDHNKVTVIDHWQFGAESGTICKMSLENYSKLAQGLGVFNALGLNTVECHKEACPNPLLQSRRHENHIFHATSHFYELGVFRSSNERPLLIYERGRIRRERIDVTDGGDGPRPLVLHHSYNTIALGQPVYTQYSNLCAAFDTPECLLELLSGESKHFMEIAFTKDEERYFGKYITFRLSKTCTYRDRELVGRLLDNDNALPWMQTEPWKLSDYEMKHKYYCCLPAEYYRINKSPNHPDAFKIWIGHMHSATLHSFHHCSNINYTTGKSDFGFPVSWNAKARYPRGVTAEDCNKNKCQFDPKKVVGADYCNRQFDPSESSTVVQECTMNYLDYS